MPSSTKTADRDGGDPPESVGRIPPVRTRRPSLLGELAAFLAHNKKWWLLPIILVLLLVGVLLVVSSGLLPIYTLF